MFLLSVQSFKGKNLEFNKKNVGYDGSIKIELFGEHLGTIKEKINFSIFPYKHFRY